MTFNQRTLCFIALMTSLLGLQGCEQSEEMTAVESMTPSYDPEGFAAHTGIAAYTQLSEASQSAQSLDGAIAEFLHQPTSITMQKAQDAWQEAYAAFLRSTIFSHLPIQDPPDWHQNRLSYDDLLLQLDSGEVQGGYIDYLQGYPYSGIVNDLALPLTEDDIRQQHRFTDDSNASLGFGVLEFLLWGESGERSSEDYFAKDNTIAVVHDDQDVIPEAPESLEESTDLEDTVEEAEDSTTGQHISPQNNNRRRQYLKLVVDILVKDLNRLQRRWEPTHGYYAQRVQANSAERTLLASFMAAQATLQEELLAKRLNKPSTWKREHQQLETHAVLDGMAVWFMDIDQPKEKASSNANTFIHLLKQTSPETAQQFSVAISSGLQCLETSRNTIQRCHDEIIQILAALEQSASVMNIPLPRLN